MIHGLSPEKSKQTGRQHPLVYDTHRLPAPLAECLFLSPFQCNPNLRHFKELNVVEDSISPVNLMQSGRSSRSYQEPKEKHRQHSLDYLTSLWNKRNKSHKNLTKTLGVLEEWLLKAHRDLPGVPLGVCSTTRLVLERSSVGLASAACGVKRNPRLPLHQCQGSAGFPLCCLPNGSSETGR